MIGTTLGITLLDKNYKALDLNDRVSLFGKIGEVSYESGAYGIYFKDGIDWNLIESKMKELKKCSNTPHFCYNERFISFWELMWNFRCCIEEICDVVEKVEV